jgi:hypothetical protein
MIVLSAKNEAPELVADAGFDFFAWLETGTIATRDVEIFIDHDAYAKSVAIQKQLTELDDEDALTLTEAATVEDTRELLLSQLEAAVARLEASKMVWSVRALSDDEINASYEAVPQVFEPMKPEGYMSDKVRAKWETRVLAYAKAKAKADADRRLWVVAQATEKIVTTTGTLTGITVEGLKTMLGRPHGAAWIAAVYKEINDAINQEATPPLPL